MGDCGLCAASGAVLGHLTLSRGRASSYPSCEHPDHQADVGATGPTIHPPPTTPLTHPTNSHHDVALTIPLPVPNRTNTSPHHADQSLSSDVLGASRRTISIATSSESSRSVSFERHPLPPWDIADGHARQSIIEEETATHMEPESLSSPPLGLAAYPLGTSGVHSPGYSAVTSISNPNITTTAIPGPRDHALDPNDPTQPEPPRYRSRSDLSAPDAVTATSQSEIRDASEYTA
ncbi:hypothetical protein BJV78DRAFT_668527 [Lactifluus subvellereus]|nr:hypothetical protein BJV78DRAFT_668527 [Lactifluus subvellereus]